MLNKVVSFPAISTVDIWLRVSSRWSKSRKHSLRIIMPRCYVIGCSENSRGEYSFHRFPRDPNLRVLWANVCFEANIRATKTPFICSKHFSDSQFCRNLQAELAGKQHLKNFRTLKSDAVPDQDIPTHVETNPRKRAGRIILTFLLPVPETFQPCLTKAGAHRLILLQGGKGGKRDLKFGSFIRKTYIKNICGTTLSINIKIHDKKLGIKFLLPSTINQQSHERLTFSRIKLQ